MYPPPKDAIYFVVFDYLISFFNVRSKTRPSRARSTGLSVNDDRSIAPASRKSTEADQAGADID
jgi:hypothetical protein